MLRLLALALLAPLVPCQEEAASLEPKPVLTFDGDDVAAPVAVCDPRGAVALRGSLDGEPIGWRIRTSLLEWLEPGTYEVGTTGTAVRIATGRGEAWSVLDQGELEIEACGLDRVAGALRYKVAKEGVEAQEHTLRFALVPELARLRPPQVIGAPEIGPSPEAVTEPRGEDLVFAALGNTGTGLPGARRVAEGLASVAKSGPLDFVLLLGDALGPEGVESTTDPAWNERFEKVFDVKRLMVPFYYTLGDLDRAANVRPVLDYGGFNPRWTMGQFTYEFEVESHGKRILFFAMDGPSAGGRIAEPAARIANRIAAQTLERSQADWKIVFSHIPLHSAGPGAKTRVAENTRGRLGQWLEKADVDLYISGGDHLTEIYGPVEKTLHVAAGGGGGPEMADSVRWEERTVFCATGGGFLWFRFDGEKLEISARDADGKVLFVHHLTQHG